METINSVATTVSSTVTKAIWGDQTQNATQGNETAGVEPISGQQGKGTATEPFDQGNAANPTGTPSSTSNPDSKSTMSSAPTTDIGPNPTNAAAGGEPKPLENTDKTGVTSGTGGDHTKGSDIVPSESSHPGVAPTSGGTEKQKQQGADRPHEAPEGKETGAVKETKDDAEDILKTRDPNDHSGEPLKVHDGTEKKSESTPGEAEGEGKGKESKGTGEQYVKSSGLQVDGGDFDATKPGAGREADRLLEEKGVHRDEKGLSGSTDALEHSGADGKKDKVPLSEKIKNKLHIGHKDK